jgi:hypothetical protein
MRYLIWRYFQDLFPIFMSSNPFHHRREFLAYVLADDAKINEGYLQSIRLTI